VRYLIVIRERGPAWVPTLAMREQQGWQEQFQIAMRPGGSALHLEALHHRGQVGIAASRPEDLPLDALLRLEILALIIESHKC